MRLLVVEDSQKMAAALVKGLRESGYAVDWAADGAAALEFAEINPYDLILLDLMLPRINGFAVCRKLRTDAYPAPILMLTARDSIEDRVAGLDEGADDYLVKPFAFDELLARIRALLRRHHDPLPRRLQVGDLTLDTGTQTADRAGKPITLTLKEYSLLEFLMRHTGEVLSRERISEHVWDNDYDPFSNLIEVYIQRLRRKIDADAGRPLIHTRRGAGYLMTAADPSAGSAAAEAAHASPPRRAQKDGSL